jgi:hypothetical protein
MIYWFPNIAGVFLCSLSDGHIRMIVLDCGLDFAELAGPERSY